MTAAANTPDTDPSTLPEGGASPEAETTIKTIPTRSPVAPISVPEGAVVPVLKKRDLIAKVSEVSGVKKTDAKKVIDAVLQEIGDALVEGVELNLPPLGKVSVNRQKEVSNAYIVIAKLRRSKGMLEAQLGNAADEGVEGEVGGA